jgi:hypothetical protein
VAEIDVPDAAGYGPLKALRLRATRSRVPLIEGV